MYQILREKSESERQQLLYLPNCVHCAIISLYVDNEGSVSMMPEHWYMCPIWFIPAYFLWVYLLALCDHYHITERLSKTILNSIGNASSLILLLC